MVSVVDSNLLYGVFCLYVVCFAGKLEGLVYTRLTFLLIAAKSDLINSKISSIKKSNEMYTI